MKTTGRIGELSGSSVHYLDSRTYHSARQDWGPSVSSSSFLSRRLNSSKNLYRKDLYAHYGCVNAIEFSYEGDLLVSGGDDRRVLLWNVNCALSGNYTPRAMKGEHNSNIFCLSFDSTNNKIFSAGNDEQVIVHDLRTGETVDVFLHREAVYGVSVSPTNDSVFASAGEDGQVLLYDMRESLSSDPVCLAKYHDAFHAVQFHPVESFFVVTANSREGVSLWDIRKPKVAVVRYGEKRCAQSSICARFNRSGSQIIALRRRLPPVLYNTHNTKPVCLFDAQHYYNSCTMKSCCFAGDNDQFVLSGSDDFNLYMWKIPDSNSTKQFVSEAHMVLRGHRSIVNEVRFNPQTFVIASSGVEKIVKLWSGVSLPGFRGGLGGGGGWRGSGAMTRRVYTHEEYIGLVLESGQVVGDVNHDYSHGSTDEDPRMMAFFDSLVQREVEGWTSNTDLSDDTHQPLSPPDDDDTTTTQSSLSLPTSQSDDNDSDDDGAGGGSRRGRTNSEERRVTDRGRSRNTTTGTRRDHRTQRDQQERHEDDDDDDDDADKVSGGSDWIMQLIAKKRAKLRIAKRARRKQKSLRRHRKKEQHILRSFTNSRRRYLYHPEGQSLSEEGDAVAGETVSTSSIEITTTRRRPSYHRRYMAPYTIMMVHNAQPESENESYDANNSDVNGTDSEEEEEETPVVSQTTVEKISETENGKRLWSSDSYSSSDNDGGLPAKRSRASFSNSDSDSDSDVSQDRKNGHIISEIIDSNASDSDVDRPVVDLDRVSERNLNSEGTSNRSNGLPDILNDATLSEKSFGDSNGMHELNISSTVSDAIPISSISSDDNGSLLFETDHNSLVSGFDLSGSLDLSTPTTRKITQNGSNQAANGATSGNTAENGMLVLPSGVEKSDEETEESGISINGADSANSEASFKFKKRMPACNLRNYRRRTEDDL